MREEFHTPEKTSECKVRFKKWSREAKRNYLVWKRQQKEK